MNGNYKHLRLPLNVSTGKEDGYEDWSDIKELERALDRWINEGGYFLPPVSVLDPPLLAAKARPGMRKRLSDDAPASGKWEIVEI